MTQSNLTALCQAWRTKADDLLRISKSYKCRSTDVLRTAYVKQSAQLRMCADELEAAIAEQPAARRRTQRAGQGLSQAVLDGAVEGDTGGSAAEGAALPDVREGQQD